MNVLLPAHYLVPFSRLGPYRRESLDDLVYRRREFVEQWAHEASIVPVEHWPLLHHRRQAHRVRPWGFERFLAQRPDYAEAVLEKVRSRGPLTAADLPEPAGGAPARMSDRWGWGLGVTRSVLEAHFGFGRLAVSDRRGGFARAYDLAERVIPARHRGRPPERHQAERMLLRLAAGALGIGTARDLADYYRMPPSAARPRLRELVEAGVLREVRVEGWRDPGLLDVGARIPRRAGAAALLSPFDPLVWCRPRVERLFDFAYRIEIYVPKPKRRWGYYVLPFLLGERLVARVDLKADRDQARLLVPAAYLEPHADADPVGTALAAELRTLARWLGLRTIAVGRRGNLARRLAGAVGA